MEIKHITPPRREVAMTRRVDASWVAPAFAWFSLVSVAFTDFYIYLVSAGVIRDFSTW